MFYFNRSDKKYFILIEESNKNRSFSKLIHTLKIVKINFLTFSVYVGLLFKFGPFGCHVEKRVKRKQQMSVQKYLKSHILLESLQVVWRSRPGFWDERQYLTMFGCFICFHNYRTVEEEDPINQDLEHRGHEKEKRLMGERLIQQ